MRPHHELIFWFRCSICGFTEFDLELISPKDRETALKNKFASRVAPLDERVWKPWLDDEN
jgi:hypothetical protein